MDASGFISTFGGFTEIKEGTMVSEAIVACGLAGSKGEARRAIRDKTVRLHTYRSDALQDRALSHEDGRFLFVLVGKNVRIIKIA